jgi:hypothetical protein
LSPEEWSALWALHAGAPSCRDCGTTDRLSVDHIVPRKRGGPDDLSNLCFRCITHNCAKGDRPDGYWAKDFYFDQLPSMSAFREFQRRIFGALTADPTVAEWFSQPASVIAGKLYLIAAVVGAGKTMAVPAIASAFNYLQRSIFAAGYRADTILVLTKEQAIRDQLANDFREQTAGFGIMPYTPRVGVLTSYDMLNSDGWLSQQDIIVACIQQFWGKKDDRPDKDVVKALGRFPLIVVDEPHFGVNQLRRLLESTPRSVVFGLTGTPIDRQAKVIRDFALVGEYTYQDADFNDGSMKFLSPDCVDTVLMRDADILSGGVQRTITDVSEGGYDARSLVTVRQIATRVIRAMERMDGCLVGTFAEHRDPSRVAADLLYPAHAMIRVADRATAEMLVKILDAFFAKNSATFKRSGGWGADYVLTGDDEIKGKKLTPDHAWMRAYRKGIDPRTGTYSCDRDCIRILVVVGMGREGVSNPLCNVVGLADDVGSVTASAQNIGRGLRAVTWIDGNGERHVSPADLDTVHIVCHEAQQHTTSGIAAGISFLLNMHDHFEDLQTVAQLAAGESVRVDPDDPPARDPLTDADRIGIIIDAVVTGGDNWRDDPATVTRVIDRLVGKYGHENDNRIRAVTEWVQEIRDNPEGLVGKTGLMFSTDEISPVPGVLMDEREDINISEARLREYIRWNHPRMEGFMDSGDASAEAWARELYGLYVSSRMMPEPEPSDQLEHIRQTYTREVKEFLKPWVDPTRRRGFPDVAHGLVGRAVQAVLDTGERVGKGTRWDCPQVHVLLRRPDVARQIRRYAIGRLIAKGFCPDAARALRITPDE